MNSDSFKVVCGIKSLVAWGTTIYQSAPPPTHKHQRCLCVGGGAKASMMGTVAHKKLAAPVNLKTKVGALKVSKQVLFLEGHLIFDWHVLPCSTMCHNAMRCFVKMSSVMSCVNACGNEWIQRV